MIRFALNELSNTYNINILLEVEEFTYKIYQNTIAPSKEDYIKYTPYQKLITENISYLENMFGAPRSPEFISEVFKNFSTINSEIRENSDKKARKNLVEDTREISWVERISKGNVEQNMKVGI
ncbi:hypothetical protein NOVO_07200 [Rickettsiales bacterium Ac37b]|nr:hypothetical protein NOVO_07200 [Rickettsiales bacterium Ac37b]